MDSKFLTIVALSDTHGMHEKMTHPVPDGDILVHAGDFCGRGKMEEAGEFASWLGAMGDVPTTVKSQEGRLIGGL